MTETALPVGSPASHGYVLPLDSERRDEDGTRSGLVGAGGVDRCTIFSHCRRYRYALWREFYSVRAIEPPLLPVEGNEAHNYLMVIGLNPSTADETQDDPTIRRCIGFAKRWGFGALCMTNLFALRATDPEIMKADPDPTGDTNDDHLWTLAKGAGMILAAWGKNGNHRDRAEAVLMMLESFAIHALAINKDGTPKHPLYVAAATVPVRLGGGGAEQARKSVGRKAEPSL